MTVRRVYSDVDDTLSINPDGTMVIVQNEDAVKQSIITILSTAKGERLMLPQFGSGLRALLFDNMDEITANLVKSEIKSAVSRWEPRVAIREIQVVPDYDNNRYVLLLDYTIIRLQTQEQFITGIRVR